MKANIHKEIFKMEPSVMVTLYEIILINESGKKYYFHAGENGFQKDIIFQGNNYYFLPIKAEGFEYEDGKLPRPTITADNTDAFFSLKTRFFKDFIGYPVHRIRTFVKFLHGDNFPNGVNPFGTPTEETFPVEKYTINAKTKEDQNIVQFEMTSPLEKEAAFIPNRKVVYNVCQWQYRHSVGCGYNGPPVADSRGNSLIVGRGKGEYSDTTTYNSGDWVTITNLLDPASPPKYYVCLDNGTVGIKPETDKTKWAEDACSKDIQGCRLRFGAGENSHGLPFGGFPGSWEY